MRRGRSVTAVVLAAALLVPIAGCGKSKPKLPKQDARALVSLLHQADSRAQAKSCDALLKRTLPRLEVHLNTLPANVDPDIRDTLRQGIANLRTLAVAQCSGVKPKPTPTNTETQTQTQPPPTTTTTTPPTTTTTTTTPPSTNTKPQTTPPPPSNPSGGTPPGGGKLGNGNGGNGNGK
jgi:hypothetical protein